jgi:hypothetical protein
LQNIVRDDVGLWLEKADQFIMKMGLNSFCFRVS